MSLQLDGIHKHFARHGDPVLDGVSLTVPTGSLTCLLGPSGAGKSTLLQIIAGLTDADAGRVVLDGRSLNGIAPHRRPLTMVMQQPHLFEHLDVIDNVAFGLRVRGCKRARWRGEALEYLRLVGIEELAARSPWQLSGGEAQRVALARALAVQPNVLLADEPFASVDAPVRRELQDLVIGLHRQLDTTIVLVTHDLTEALAMADRLAVLDGGRIREEGEPQAIYERPTSEQAARLLGVTNRWHGILHDGRLQLGERCFVVCPRNAMGPLDGPRRSMWAIRPERIRVASERAANTFAGPVTALRYLGPIVEATIAMGSHTVLAHFQPDHQLRVGDAVSIELPAEHLIELQNN